MNRGKNCVILGENRVNGGTNNVILGKNLCDSR